MEYSSLRPWYRNVSRYIPIVKYIQNVICFFVIFAYYFINCILGCNGENRLKNSVIQYVEKYWFLSKCLLLYIMEYDIIWLVCCLFKQTIMLLWLVKYTFQPKDYKNNCGIRIAISVAICFWLGYCKKFAQIWLKKEISVIIY